MVRLVVEIRGVDSTGLLLGDGEAENHVARGDGVVFLFIETEDVGAILAVGSQPSHNRARREKRQTEDER